ncbi:hypothetical protein C8J55DRAFT_583455 [Lentinula edodes]|uniref:Uncharacterized protein n=1 Tax=Lentinula lateritia TaxID=40482 RepID=A0A9W8ZZ53_9AGAR|nr:hypothetical protein C8J55DRAFT_583455 [Lentinula edodes]
MNYENNHRLASTSGCRIWMRLEVDVQGRKLGKADLATGGYDGQGRGNAGLSLNYLWIIYRCGSDEPIRFMSLHRSSRSCLVEGVHALRSFVFKLVHEIFEDSMKLRCEVESQRSGELIMPEARMFQSRAHILAVIELAVVVIREIKLGVGPSFPIFHSGIGDRIYDNSFTTGIPKNIFWYDIRAQSVPDVPPGWQKSVDISFTIGNYCNYDRDPRSSQLEKHWILRPVARRLPQTTFELLEHLQSSYARTVRLQWPK